MTVLVSDPPGAAADNAMPMVRLALQPAYMARRLQEVLVAQGRFGTLELQAILVRRHKPGKRCLIEYQLMYTDGNRAESSLNLLGKIRAKGLDQRSCDIQTALWRQGFGPQADDHIGVPEPCGVLPELAMWLQHKVDGVPAIQRLSEPHGVELAGRISGAIHKLHCSGVPTRRCHTMDDELDVLQRQLAPVADANPQWNSPIRKILKASERLGASLPAPELCPSHRDCYPDNVMVNGGWLYLIDLDLYCMADPALDIGNFIGHVTELALRHHGQPGALIHLERALADGFLARAGEASRAAVSVYSMLTLVRHIAISQRIPARRDLTPQFIEFCEHRLGSMF